MQVVNGPEVLSKYVGQAEENIRNLFGEAEAEYKEKGDTSVRAVLQLGTYAMFQSLSFPQQKCILLGDSEAVAGCAHTTVCRLTDVSGADQGGGGKSLHNQAFRTFTLQRSRYQARNPFACKGENLRGEGL